MFLFIFLVFIYLCLFKINKIKKNPPNPRKKRTIFFLKIQQNVWSNVSKTSLPITFY